MSNRSVILIQKAARVEGSFDVEGDLVGEVYDYLVSGKYCDGASAGFRLSWALGN